MNLTRPAANFATVSGKLNREISDREGRSAKNVSLICVWCDTEENSTGIDESSVGEKKWIWRGRGGSSGIFFIAALLPL